MGLAPRGCPYINIVGAGLAPAPGPAPAGVSRFRRAGPSAFPPGRQRPGSGKDEALERPSPPWQPVFPKGYRRERALPAPCTTSARPFTAWPTGPRRFWDTPCGPGGVTSVSAGNCLPWFCWAGQAVHECFTNTRIAPSFVDSWSIRGFVAHSWTASPPPTINAAGGGR